MDEKILCTSEKFNLKPSKKAIKLIALILFVISFIVAAVANDWFNFGDTVLLFLILTSTISLIWAIIYYFLHNYEMTVTDKRIYGKIRFGNRVDLPIDSISATEIISFLYGISVATSSGKIKFYGIKNRYQMYSVINDLLISRQNNKNNLSTTISVPTSPKAPENKTETPDDLIKLKELLDKGIITQEEFDTKKKQILGL